MKPNETQLVTLLALAVLLPPLAVAIVSRRLLPVLLSIVLSFFFYLPGVVFAVWVVLKEEK